MNIRGTHRFDAPREAVFAAIRDPRVLLAVIPGCEAVEQVAPDEYDGRISLRLPGVVGTYRTLVRLVDAASPTAGLEGEVDGSLGSITGHADFRLAEPTAARTTWTTAGRASIGGPLARLDSRFAEGSPDRSSTRACAPWTLRLATEGSRVTVTHYFLPASVPEALACSSEHGPELLVMAGGTVAMPLINEGISLPAGSWACAGPASTGSSASATRCASAPRRR